MLGGMSGDRSGSAPDSRADDSWASETLPLSIRKELLERELSKLGLRSAAATAAAKLRQGGTAQQQQQQQPQGEAVHPPQDAPDAAPNSD
jgi:hypothetical protein